MKRLLSSFLLSVFVFSVFGVAACDGASGGGPSDDAQVTDAATDAAADAAPVATNTPGKHLETLTVGGQPRTFIVYVPELARGQVAPVVFMLHGTSGDGQKFYAISGWKEKADAEGMIVVFPDALTHCFFEDENDDGDFADADERKITTKWASGQIGDASPLCTAAELAALQPAQRALVDHPLADDLAFFDAMRATLAERYRIDAKALYVTGFSNGGQMAARLAVARSDVIAAVHVAAGTLTVPEVATRPLSLIFSVGSLDDRFTSAAGVAELPLTEEDLAALPVFKGIVAAYLNGLQLAQDYTFQEQTVGGEGVARFHYATSLAGADNTFEAVVLEGLDHAYPNGQNHPIRAADTVWTFFKDHRLP